MLLLLLLLLTAPHCTYGERLSRALSLTVKLSQHTVGRERSLELVLSFALSAAVIAGAGVQRVRELAIFAFACDACALSAALHCLL